MLSRSFFDEVFENFWNAALPARSARTVDWSFRPPVESGWTDEHLNLRVVLPGVSERDLKVSVQGNQLYIHGERKAPEGFGKDGYVWNAIPYGKFERLLELPAGLDVDKLQAQLHDGFLDIRVPVATAMKPKEIPITKQIAA
jgi:HSP20 family protein